MKENDYIKHILIVARKPGLFWSGGDSFVVACSYISGFDMAHDGKPLEGFRYWLLTKRETWSEGAWWWLIRDKCFPKTSNNVYPSLREEHILLDYLYKELKSFFEVRSNRGLHYIYATHNERFPKDLQIKLDDKFNL